MIFWLTEILLKKHTAYTNITKEPTEIQRLSKQISKPLIIEMFQRV